MHSDDHENLVADVADALTLNEDVHWDRCATLATPADRRVLDNLRTLAGMLPGREVAGPAPAARPATSATLSAGTFVRRAVRVVIAVAAIEVVAALTLLPWQWDGYQHDYGDFAVFLLALLVGHGASGSPEVLPACALPLPLDSRGTLGAARLRSSDRADA